MEWIDVNERLPDGISDYYLHCNVGDHKSTVAGFDKHTGCFYWHEMNTHYSEGHQMWMELPKPPQTTNK